MELKNIDKFETNEIKGNINTISNSKILFILLWPCVILGKIIKFSIMGFGSYHPTADILLSIMSGNYYLGTDNTFSKFAMLYKYTNILNLNTYIQYEIVLTILFNVLLFVFIYKNQIKINKLNFLSVVFIMLSIILLNVYVFSLCKEPWIFICFLAIYLVVKYISKNWLKILGLGSILFFMIYFMKIYYVLIVLFGFFIYFLYKIFKTNKNFIKFFIVLFACTVLYLIILITLKNFSIEYYDKMLSSATEEYELANSVIKPLLPGTDIFSLGINYFVKVLRLLFPIELVFNNFKYIPYVIFQIFLSIYIIIISFRFNGLDIKKQIMCCIFIGFILTSATFEPDYGSWLRHELSCFPVFTFIIIDEKLSFYRRRTA